MEKATVTSSDDPIERSKERPTKETVPDASGTKNPITPPSANHNDQAPQGKSQFNLLGSRRFLPLFITQALGAFNDNAFKNALVILVTYRLAEAQGISGPLFITMAAGLFILPFFLFSATAGQLADKYEKTILIRRIKLAEIGLMILAGLGFYLQNITLLMSVLFLLGTQSTFFGPIKYGILPQHLKDDELIGGNGLIETGTFLSILLGTLFGGLLILSDFGLSLVSASILGLSILGYISCRYIPEAKPPVPDLKVNLNFVEETYRIIANSAKKRTVFLCILAISWFWLVGTIFLTQFPTFAKDIAFADEQVSNLFIAVFTIGIMVGSLYCNKLLNGEITAKYVPLAAIAITLFSLDLVWASQSFSAPADGQLITLSDFLRQAANWRVLFDLMMISAFGGLYVVPLYAMVQHNADPKSLARTIAGNNIINAAFMVAASLYALAMIKSGFTVLGIFMGLAIANAFVALYICKLLPQDLVKAIGRFLFRTFYRVEIKGMENYKKASDKLIIIANHASYLDAPILGSFLPDTPLFGINTHVADKWWVKPAFALFDLVPIDPANPMGLKGLIRDVEKGRKCVIFPEGRITNTGALMKIYEGPGMIADNAGAEILPIRIEGAQHSFFSRLRGKTRLRLFPKITVTILEPQTLDVDPKLKGRGRREAIGHKLYDIMTDMVFKTSKKDRTLFNSLISAAKVHGQGEAILEDVERTPMNYRRLILGSFVLGGKIAKRSKVGENIGVLLPNSLGSVVTFMALQAYGRVPAMLNFSAGPKAVRSACQTAKLKTVLTSRRFIELGRLEDIEMAINQGAKIIYLEDIKNEIKLWDKLSGLFKSLFAETLHHHLAGSPSPEDPAVILFTSGSEGLPKGVVLSHHNLQSNRFQIASRVDFTPTDIVFNALPIFHSFGLTGGLLLPMLSGVKIFLYPSPLHYRIIPELVYDTNATILFGTDTFLSGYAKQAHSYDFYSVRYIFAGAEKLKDQTRKIWSEKFGIRIFEGYGATETAPVLAVNTAMQFKAGTVGSFLPAIETRLEKVEGIDEGGRLYVKGPNIMKGYLRHENPGIIEPPEDGWYDTGDIVSIDAQGFVSIEGRAKRFAKIAGEMVSLTSVERFVQENWPEHPHAVIAMPDEKKGEKLVLATEDENLARPDLMARAQQAGFPELYVPREILSFETLPILGTGKMDLVSLQDLVIARLS